MHRTDGAAAGRAIEDRRLLHAPKMFAAVGGQRQAGEGEELGPGHLLEADIEQVQAARPVDHVAEDHAVVVETAAPADVEHRLGADPHDRRRVVRAHVDIADAADALAIAKAGVDADALIVEAMRRGRERRVAHPAAHAMPRGFEHQPLFAPLGHAHSELHVEAGLVRHRARRRADVDPARLGIARHQRAGADHVVWRHLHVVVESGVHADEAVRADLAVA